MHDIPMLDDLAVFKTEDIHDRRSTTAGFKDQMTVHDDVIAFRDDPFWFHARARVSLREPFNKPDKRFGTICRAGVVLSIVRAEVPGHRFLGPALIKGEVGPLAHDLLVLLG